jgi:hypothetical protein
MTPHVELIDFTLHEENPPLQLDDTVVIDFGFAQRAHEISASFIL